MRITVTQEHIQYGESHRRGGSELTCTCPIAQALHDAGYVNVQVLGDGTVGGKRLSLRAQKFIEDFDAERPVAPFRFNFSLK